MKRLFQSLFLLTLPALLLTAACHREIPVDTIRIEPASATLFVGETLDITVSCYPEDATNTDELMVYSTNERIASYQNGTVTARSTGTAAITAACGNVLDQCRIKVYKDKFQKGDNTYGVDYATGYLYYNSEATVQEVEIILVHNDPNGDLQKFDVWVQYDQLGKELDYTKPQDFSFVGAYVNNNEDGFLVFSSTEGQPSIRLADWGDPGDVTLTRGILKVENPEANRYRIHADFELSNGYRFSTDWEDAASMKIE